MRFRRDSVLQFVLARPSRLSGERSARGRPSGFLYLVWYALVFSLGFTDLVLLPSVFRDSLQISTLLLGVLVVGLASSTWLTGARIQKPDLTSTLLYLFLGFAAISVLQSVWSPLQEYRGERLWDKGIRQVLALSICVATYAVTIAMVQSRANAIKSLAVYVSSLGAAMFAGLVDLLNFYSPSPTVSFFAHLIHRNVLIAPAQIQDVIVPRLQLLAFEPSIAANYLLAVVPVAFALVATTRRQPMRLLMVAAGLVGCLMFVGTFSLGGVLAAWAALLAFVVLGHFVLGWRRILQIAVVGATALAVLSLIPIQTGPQSTPTSPPTTSAPTPASRPAATPVRSLSPETDSRLVTALGQAGTTSADVSTSWRLIMLATAWNTFVDHPIAGVGWGNSGFYILEEFPTSGWQHPNAVAWTSPDGIPASTTSSNNMVARVLAETGVLGALLFIGWHAAVAWRGIRTLRAGDSLALGLLIAAAGVVAHYSALSGLSLRYWFFLPGMIVAISLLASGKEKAMSLDAPTTTALVAPGRTKPATSQ